MLFYNIPNAFSRMEIMALSRVVPPLLEDKTRSRCPDGMLPVLAGQDPSEKNLDISEYANIAFCKGLKASELC